MSLSIVLYSEDMRQPIVETWESSVRATHNFLKEEDIQFFKSFVSNMDFNSLTVYCGLTEQKELVGFLGVDNHKLEMLFLNPQHIGKGYGKILLDYAVKKLEANELDVNEDNKNAVGFYKKYGFEVTERTPLDGTGKPYPILKMKLKNPDVSTF
jgi:putative acetyltransferase